MRSSIRLTTFSNTKKDSPEFGKHISTARELCVIMASNTFHTVEDIETYIRETDSWINNFLENVGWTAESVLETEDHVPCSVDPSHLLQAKSLEKHMSSCCDSKKGYSKEELNMDKSSDFYYAKSTTVVPVKLDPEMVHSIVCSIPGMNHYPNSDTLPKTMDRYLSDLSPAQRLKIYEYCIQTAHETQRLQMLSEEELLLLSENPNKKLGRTLPKSQIEILAEERDLKRRRQSYKGKKVHSGKKSHLEVLREVIENQMEILQELWEEEKTKEEKSKQSDRASASRACYSKDSRDSEQSERRSYSNYSRGRKSKSRSPHRSKTRQRSRSRSRSRREKTKKRKNKSRSKSPESSERKHKKKKKHKSKD